MRVLLQRVKSAHVEVDGDVVGRIDRPGLVALVGITHDDTEAEVRKLAEKSWRLRILADEQSAEQLAAPILAVSQFTLYADARKGRRPSWNGAAPRETSEPLVEAYVRVLTELGAEVATGIFGADMDVHLVNDGPVTLLLES